MENRDRPRQPGRGRRFNFRLSDPSLQAPESLSARMDTTSRQKTPEKTAAEYDDSDYRLLSIKAREIIQKYKRKIRLPVQAEPTRSSTPRSLSDIAAAARKRIPAELEEETRYKAVKEAAERQKMASMRELLISAKALVVTEHSAIESSAESGHNSYFGEIAHFWPGDTTAEINTRVTDRNLGRSAPHYLTINEEGDLGNRMYGTTHHKNTYFVGDATTGEVLNAAHNRVDVLRSRGLNANVRTKTEMKPKVISHFGFSFGDAKYSEPHTSVKYTRAVAIGIEITW